MGSKHIYLQRNLFQKWYASLNLLKVSCCPSWYLPKRQAQHDNTTKIPWSRPINFPWISNSDPVGSNSNHNRNQKLSISTPPNQKTPVSLFLPPTNHFCWTFSPKKKSTESRPILGLEKPFLPHWHRANGTDQAGISIPWMWIAGFFFAGGVISQAQNSSNPNYQLVLEN